MPEITSIIWGVATSLITLLLGVVGYFLKRTMTRTDKHEEDINNIKLTYVNKDMLKELKDDLRGEYSKLAEDVEEIKKNYLTKQDFLGAQTRTDRQLERITQILMDMKGGGSSGKS